MIEAIQIDEIEFIMIYYNISMMPPRYITKQDGNEAYLECGTMVIRRECHINWPSRTAGHYTCVICGKTNNSAQCLARCTAGAKNIFEWHPPPCLLALVQCEMMQLEWLPLVLGHTDIGVNGL